ncbi:MAG: hypothetical protein CMF42_04610 [Legionellales bacterium]|nr:hypothetical protein [Legionellales bacterium]OUX67300.1 MAG: hypothetical protein CBD38_02800 [bacterium TMED178]|tara:strand:- start:10173 stop:11408 length:1236 start_codon:yes stop_codon:yes gene_type:complete
MVKNRQDIARFVLGLISVIFMYSFNLVSSCFILDMSDEFGVSAGIAGLILSSSLLCNALAQIPGSAILMRLGTKNFLSRSYFAFAIIALLLVQSKSIVLFIIGRFLMSACISIHFVVYATLTKKIMPLSMFSRLMILSEGLVMLVEIVFNYSLASLGIFSWKLIFKGYAVVGMLLSVTSYLIFYYDQFDMKHVKNVQYKSKQMFQVMHTLLSDRELIGRSILAASLFMILPIVYGLWWPTFISVSKGIAFNQAVMQSQWIAFGIIVGNIIFCCVDNKYHDSNDLFIWSNIVSIVSLTMMLYYPTLSNIVMDLLMIVVGIACSTSVIAFSILRSRDYPNELSVGFINTFIVISAPLTQVLITFVMESIYPLWFANTHYHLVQLGLLMCPLIQLLALVFGSLFISYQRPRLSH